MIGTYSKVSNKQIFKKICFCGIIGCCEFIKSLSSQNSQLSKVETEVRTSSLARILQCFPQPYAFILSRALMISALCTYSILYAYCIQEYIILYSRISTWLSIPTLYSMSYQKRIIDLESQVKSTQYKKLCGSYIKIWNLPNYMKKQNKEHQNARFINEKLKTKSLMFFVSFFSCDLQDFKF